jgi:CheY-like chemotaxis protein
LKDLEDLPVLVLDDNATNRLILEQMLTNWQMKPTVVDGARPALEALEQALSAGRPFPLVITDANMPEMDGFGLVERIRGRPALAGTTIMMLTSNNRLGDAARCRELGVAAYLMKPVGQSNLLDAIMTSLGERSTDDGQPVQEAAPPIPDCRLILHVLVAEDNAVNQKLAVRLLEKRGHKALVAGDGRQALAALENERFDLVLMDVQMPHMNGFEATAAIRAKEESTGEHIPIVAMTAQTVAALIDPQLFAVAGCYTGSFP